MKYQVGLLDVFMSPSSGKTYLQPDYILVGNTNGYSQASPALIDLRLEVINTKVLLSSAKLIVQSPISGLSSAQALNSLTDGLLKNVGGVIKIATGGDYPPSDATYVTNTPNEFLPDAQDLESLFVDDGEAVILKVIDGGLFTRAIPDVDYAKKETLEKIRDEAETARDEAEKAAAEADASAAEAAKSASEAATSELNAGLSEDQAKIYADNAGLAAGDADGYASDAADSARSARKDALNAGVFSGIAEGASSVALGAAGAAAASASAALGAASSANSSASQASGSASAASSSAGAAAGSASAASTSASGAATSAGAAASSASSAAASLATFLGTNIELTGAIVASALVGSPIPTVFADNPAFPGTGGATIPHGTTAQRLATLATIRFNTDTGFFEGTPDGSTWNAFSTTSGSVTTINTGTGLTGGPITSSGTISLANTAVTPGTYNFSTLTVDAQGRLTAASSGAAVTSIAAGTGLSGGTITSTGTIALANTAVTAGTYTNMTATVDAQGRLTAASNGSAPVLISGSTMTGPLILSADPTSALGAATKQYVDVISQGLFFHKLCYAATTANLTVTYSNGTAGVGATLTNSGTLAAFSIDGVSPAINSRILVKNQTSHLQNGIYVLGTVGSGSVAYVLTRSTDYDETTEIHAGDIVPVEFGTVNGGTSWLQIDTVVTIGTDAIEFNQYTYNQNQFLQCSNNLSDLPSVSTARTNLGISTSNHCVLIGNSSGGISAVPNGGAQYVFVSSLSGDPSWTNSLLALNQVNCANLGIQDNSPGTLLSVCGNGQIGFASGTTSPSNGLAISGDVGIGTSSPASKLHVVKSTSYALQDYGLFTFDTATSSGSGISGGYDTTNNWAWIYARSVGSTARVLNLNGNLFVGALGSNSKVGIGLAPSYPFHLGGSRTAAFTAFITGTHSSSAGTTAGLVIDEVITPTTAIGTAMHEWIYPNFDATGGTINVAAALYIDGGGNAGGTITNGYGIFITNPGFGSTKCALYSANGSIGYTGVTPPTSGLIVNGKTFIGASSATSVGAKMEVTTGDSTYGILHTQGTVTLSSYLSSGATIPAQFGTTSNHNFGFYVNNGSPILNILTSGNIGAGTPAPASPFHVVKNSSYALQDYGAFTVDTASSGGSGLSMGYDTGNAWGWIYSRIVGNTGRKLNINNVLYIGENGSPNMSLGTSSGTGGAFTCAMLFIPDGNKTRNIGSTSNRWNTIFYASATTGTSRLAKSRTQCNTCQKPMMRGTGTNILLGEEADYISVFCLDCGDQKIEAVRHLPTHRLAERKIPDRIEFLGFKVCQYSGNSRGIQVKYRYDNDKENSTFLSDHEYDQFLSMKEEERTPYLKELGLREWHALEEVRLMEEECSTLQSNLDNIVNHLVGSDLMSSIVH